MGYIICADDKKSVIDTISLSCKLMNGNKLKIIKLSIKMIFWVLLCLSVIPIIYVMPYMKTSFAVCSKWIVQLNPEYETNKENKITEEQVIF